MNHELFSFSLMASILGIAIVFISLLGLSLLMVLLKVLFQDKEPKTASAAVQSGKPSTVPAAPAEESQEGNDWIMAAVAAYLIQEDLPAPSAASWVSRSSEVMDPWMNRAAFDRTLV